MLLSNFNHHTCTIIEHIIDYIVYNMIYSPPQGTHNHNTCTWSLMVTHSHPHTHTHTHSLPPSWRSPGFDLGHSANASADRGTDPGLRCRGRDQPGTVVFLPTGLDRHLLQRQRGDSQSLKFSSTFLCLSHFRSLSLIIITSPSPHTVTILFPPSIL